MQGDAQEDPAQSYKEQAMAPPVLEIRNVTKIYRMSGGFLSPKKEVVAKAAAARRPWPTSCWASRR